MYAIRQNFIALFWPFSLVAFDAAKLTAQTSPTLRVGLVTRSKPVPGAASIARGVRLGAAEAKRTAMLFGGSVLLFEDSVTSSAEAAAARLLSQRNVELLVGSSAQDAEALSRFAETHGLIFFNVASRSSALRVSCRRHTFHVEASDSMYSSALRRRTTPGEADSAVLWAASLEKYGASQINERFRNRYNLPMDGSAWAGWIAVKIAAEAALRAQSAHPASLLAYLEASSTSFDGHKGWPLSFRSVDHQLRQPLYVVARLPVGSAPRIQETPQLSALAAAGATANQLLDQLMPRASSCRQNRT